MNKAEYVKTEKLKHNWSGFYLG